MTSASLQKCYKPVTEKSLLAEVFPSKFQSFTPRLCDFFSGRCGSDWCSRRHLGTEGHCSGADEERSQFDLDRAEDLGEVLALYHAVV